MKKFNVIILAGGEKGPLYEPTGYEIKALIPVHGKPMIDWVVEGFAACEAVESIVVVGDRQLDECASMVRVKKRIFTGANLFQNLLHAVTYIKTTMYKDDPDHAGYVISFCDAVFLTPGIIKDTLASIAAQDDASAVLHYVEKSAFEKAGLPVKRTYIPIGKGLFTGSTIYYLKKFSLVQNAVPMLLEMRKHRKDPRGLLNALGCEGTSFSEVENAVSRMIDAKVRIVESPHARLGMDVDKPSDLELAQQMLESPWKHHYRKAVVIYNPVAGTGRPVPRFLRWLFNVDNRINHADISSGKMKDAITDALAKCGIRAQLYTTEKRGDAERIAARCAAEGCDLVVVAGGGGTVNEVVNGIAGSGVTLGMIPLGTANLMALSLAIPRSLEGACQYIASGEKRTIDCGKAGDRYFVLMAGIGFDAFVVKHISTGKKRSFGTLGYLPAIAQYLFSYTFRPISMTIDSQRIKRKGYMVVVGNSRYYGGKLVLAPEADMTDGYLDISIFRHRNLFSLLYYLYSLWRGKTGMVGSMEYFQGKRIVIHPGGGQPVHVDAESCGTTPLLIEVCPGMLSVAAK